VSFVSILAVLGQKHYIK